MKFSLKGKTVGSLPYLNMWKERSRGKGRGGNRVNTRKEEMRIAADDTMLEASSGIAPPFVL